MKELLLRTLGGTPALALTKDRRLLEYWNLDEDLAFKAGAVYLGRAGRVMKSLQALFVTLAPGVEGFLPFDELAGAPRPEPGQALLVQVKKPPQGGKAAYLTCDIALPGRYAMLLPRGSHAAASKRVPDKQAMKQLARRLCPEGMGLVLRASAAAAEKDAIAAEIARLKTGWQDLLDRAGRAMAPALLTPAPGILARLMRDERELPEQIITDDERAARGLGLPTRVHPDPFGLYGVEQQLHQALRRVVRLPSGGQLVLDPCEAALLIDVNTAQDGKKAGDLMLRTNLEAANEIARLLRLRRAGGIILIDFIGMDTEAQRAVVQSALEEALKEDRITSEVLGFTRLGLMEMTRKKAEPKLLAQRLAENDHGMEEDIPDDA
ncbi:MAG TPA: ribonuclease E/G [Clostridia bacterium]|nr:ribonuclease E/G [Clostridia bacterium]